MSRSRRETKRWRADGGGRAHARTRALLDGVDSIDLDPSSALTRVRNYFAHNRPVLDYEDVEDKLGIIHNRYNSAVKEAREQAEPLERHWYNDLVQPCDAVTAEVLLDAETDLPSGHPWEWDYGQAQLAHSDSKEPKVDNLTSQYAQFYGSLADFITARARNSSHTRRLRPIYDEHSSAQLPLWNPYELSDQPAPHSGTDSWLFLKIDEPASGPNAHNDKAPKNLVIVISPQARAAGASEGEPPPTALKLDLEGSTVLFALTGTEDSRELVGQLEKVWKAAATKTTDRTAARKS